MGNAVIRQLFKEQHTSVNAINTYRRCPRSYQYRYIHRAPPETRASNLLVGTAVHDAMAFFYIALQQKEKEPSLDKLFTVFTAKFNYELKKKDAPPVLFSDKEDAESLFNTGKDLLQAFLDKAERPYRVVEVEMPFNLELIPGRRFVGVFDAVVQDADSTYRILEHKTAARRWPESRITNDLQVSLYSAVAPMLGLADARVDIQLLLKQKTPDFEVHQAPRNQRDTDEAKETLNGVMKAVDAGIFYVNRDWHCGSCPYASLCVAG